MYHTSREQGKHLVQWIGPWTQDQTLWELRWYLIRLDFGAAGEAHGTVDGPWLQDCGFKHCGNIKVA